MEKVFQMPTFKDRINIINKSFPNFQRVQCHSYSSAFISLHYKYLHYQYLHYSSHHQTSSKESVVSSLFSTAYYIITNEDDLHKENARIKQVLKENGYRESIINKIFRRITNNHSLPQSQQLTQTTDIQEEEIRISINLLYVEGTSEKLQHILRSHKIRSTFYTEMTV